jgi:hypothetical protein
MAAEKLPLPLAVQLTIPPGTPGVPVGLLSLTVAVQVVGAPTPGALGLQATRVFVVRNTVSFEVAELVWWVVSPP